MSIVILQPRLHMKNNTITIFFKCFFLWFTISQSCARSLSSFQERVIGESLYSMYNSDSRSLELIENYFHYELNRVCDLGKVELDYPLTLSVIDSPQINAFATAGSFIFIYTGILKRLSDVSEIMGVLCHELTHTHEHHIRRQMERMDEMANQKGLLLASLPAMVFLPGIGELLYGMAIDQTVLQQFHFSQQMEFEADYGAVELLQKGGFDTNKLISGFESISRYDCFSSKLPDYFSYYSTHPLTKERIARISHHQAELGPIIPQVKRAQLDYILCLSELHPDHLPNSPDFAEQNHLIETYRNAVRTNQLEPLLETYPQSIVLKLQHCQSLRNQKKWDALVEALNRYSTNPYWSSLPLVKDIWCEKDFYTMKHRDFIRKYQNLICDTLASPLSLQYLAHAYSYEKNMSFYHLVQARYFSNKGDYNSALKEIQHKAIDRNSFYYDELLKEIEMKLDFYKSLL